MNCNFSEIRIWQCRQFWILKSPINPKNYSSCLTKYKSFSYNYILSNIFSLTTFKKMLTSWIRKALSPFTFFLSSLLTPLLILRLVFHENNSTFILFSLTAESFSSHNDQILSRCTRNRFVYKYKTDQKKMWKIPRNSICINNDPLILAKLFKNRELKKRAKILKI